MSDLQDALDWYEHGKPMGDGSSLNDRMSLILDAARIYANPNIEAAADAVRTYWLNGTTDPDLNEWWTTDEASEAAAEIATLAVDAALTSQEDTK